LNDDGRIGGSKMFGDVTYYKKADKPFNREDVMKKIRQYATAEVAASFNEQSQKVLERVYRLIQTAELEYSDNHKVDPKIELGIIVASAHRALCGNKPRSTSIIPP
jgi:hypothetical protein